MEGEIGIYGGDDIMAILRWKHKSYYAFKQREVLNYVG